jgi:hypothetical protein
MILQVPVEKTVIPAKAGTQSVESAFAKVCEVDSRPSASSGQAFRGNDSRLVNDRIPNDTNTALTPSLTNVERCANFTSRP